MKLDLRMLRVTAEASSQHGHIALVVAKCPLHHKIALVFVDRPLGSLDLHK